MPTAVALAVVTFVGRRLEWTGRRGEEVRFAESVVGELRAGGSLRTALRAACAARDDCADIVRLLDVGAPLEAGTGGLARRLPVTGELIAAAVSAGAGGGRMVPVFEEILLVAAADGHARDEVRADTAQVRASLWVLVGGPSAYIVWLAGTGGWAALVASPGGGALVGIGGTMFLSGVAAMAWMGSRRR